MGGGGKGGSQTTTVKLDPRMEEGAVQGIAAALRSAALPFIENRGTQIAAFSPSEMQGFENVDLASQSLGLGTAGGGGYLPAPQMTADGFYGYSTADQYDEMMAKSVTDEERAAREAVLVSYSDAADRVLGTVKPGAGYRPPVPPSQYGSSAQPAGDKNDFNRVTGRTLAL